MGEWITTVESLPGDWNNLADWCAEQPEEQPQWEALQASAFDSWLSERYDGAVWRVGSELQCYVDARPDLSESVWEQFCSETGNSETPFWGYDVV